MNKSLFIQFVDKYFGPIVRKLTETINGKKEEQLLHTTMLTEEYSPDLNWGSTELQTSIVAADVVAVNSTIPLKRRDSIRSASGKIPKLGIKFQKNENDINTLNVMAATGAEEATIAAKLLNDVPRAVNGIRHRVEILFQQGLSTGQVLVTGSDDNTGTGVRATFGYLPENIFHCTAGAWGSGAEEPIADVEQLFTKAAEDGASISLVMMSKDYFNRLRASQVGKLLAANHNGQTVTNLEFLAKPTRSSMLEALEDEFGATFKIVDSSFKIEGPNGERKTVRPWEQANVVGLTSENVGRLVYGRLAEETNPVADVSYQKSGSYILVSKFSKNEPLREFTSAQAFVIPVIDGGNNIYVLHADSASESLLKADVDPVEFTKAAASKTVDMHYDGTAKLTATSDADWATVSVSKDKVKVAVTANDTEAERKGTVTVTDGTASTTFEVIQGS